jgi:AcrR family transcriptional regulator
MSEAGLKPGRFTVEKRQGAGRPAACDVEGRREFLLETATAVFLEFGYQNASVSEIAERAGASKRTIYARYPTKAELFIAVVTRKIAELHEEYAKTLVTLDPLAKVLDEFGSIVLHSMLRTEFRALYRVIISEVPEFPELASAFWEVGPKHLMIMLAEYLARHPEFKGANPDHAAEMFCSMCWGLHTLKFQFYKDYVMPEEAMESNVKEAVRIFLLSYS